MTMKKRIHALTARQLIFGISGAVSFLVFLILWAVIDVMGSRQLSQQMAERWSEESDAAQVSCFFSTNAYITPDSIESFRYSLDKALLEASITQTSPNAGARLWADAYSADGKIIITSDMATLEADAVGIGGDFFLFHPLQLLSGSYFSENDLNQDYCVLDEDAAWQLFGSNNVAGMTVSISGIPHIVAGVVERDRGKLEEAAGLDSTVVYVSYSTLDELGWNNGINHYEIVMPNPVSSYALNYVKENIGVEEKELEIVENTSRYGLLNRLRVIAAFGTRSMNGKAIIYPYWENVARGYEDILALLTLVALLALFYPVLVMVIALVRWWKHKNWTVKDVFLKLKDKWERYLEKRREQKKSGKPGERRKRRKKEENIIIQEYEEEEGL